MSDMIEKVAKAICVSMQTHPDTEYGVFYADERVKGWELYREQADAAIKAMREVNDTDHAKGIDAALKVSEDVDWVAGLFGSGVGSAQQLFEAQLEAYMRQLLPLR